MWRRVGCFDIESGADCGMVSGFYNVLLAKVLLLWAGLAAADSFSCTLKPVSKTGWIPARVLVQFQEGHQAARIQASDDGGPIPAAMTRRSDRSYLLDWTPSRAVVAKATELSNDRYRAVLNLENLKVSLQVLTGLAPGAHSLRGAGTCIRLDNTMP
jgi:hypothetical protein